jgi:hypothetical protein
LKESLQQRGKEASIDLLDKASNRLKGGRLGQRSIKGAKKPGPAIRKKKQKPKKTVKTQLGLLKYG